MPEKLLKDLEIPQIEKGNREADRFIHSITQSFEVKDIEANMVFYNFEKLNRKKILEKGILYSCLSLIGAYWVWILAIAYLIFYRDTEENFLNSWEKDERILFRNQYPYREEFYELFTKDKTFYGKFKNANQLKSINVIILAVPIVGWAILVIISFISIGFYPYLVHRYTKSPLKYMETQMAKKYKAGEFTSSELKILSSYDRFGFLSFNFKKFNSIFKKLHLDRNTSVHGIFSSNKWFNPVHIIITSKNIVIVSKNFFRMNKYTFIDKHIITDFFFDGNRSFANLLKLNEERPSIDYYLGVKHYFRNFIILLTTGSQVMIPNIHIKNIDPIKTAVNKMLGESSSYTAPKARPTEAQTTESFHCQICETSRPATMARMKCNSCSRFVCLECFSNIASAGRTTCPMCGGLLTAY